jgi:hypothetical protein
VLSPSPSTDAPVKIFLSFSHKDDAFHERLDTALAGLKRSGLIQIWDDRRISPGADWEKKLSSKLDEAEIVLLLISPDFIASDYCVGREMRRAMENVEAGRQTVIPVILRPYVWPQAEFNKLQGLPKNFKPISLWKNRDDAYKNVVEGVGNAAQEVKRKRGAPPEASAIAKEQSKALRQLLLSHRARASAAFAFVALITLALLAQYSLRLRKHADVSQDEPVEIGWPYAIADAAYAYQMNSLPVIHRPTTHPAGVITLKKGREPAEIFPDDQAGSEQFNERLCERRAFFAALLRRMERFNPRVVVLDTWFTENPACPSQRPAKDTRTTDLLNAIRSLASQGRRVTIGQDSEDAATLRRLLDVDLQVVAPNQIDVSKLSPNISTGLVTLNYNLQMAPLAWPLFTSVTKLYQGRYEVTDSLSMAALRAYRPENTDRAFADLVLQRPQLLASLSYFSDFHPISALTVLCGDHPATDWRKCPSPADIELPEELRYPMLFIGIDDPDSGDHFQTTGGEGAGVVLQANYTLALLQRRFYTPLFWWFQLILSALFVVSLELVLRRLRRSLEFALIVSITATLILDVVVVKVLTERQEYLELWIPLLPIFVLRYGVEHWRLSETFFGRKRQSQRRRS